MRTRQSLSSTCSTKGQSRSILTMRTGSVASRNVMLRSDVKLYALRGHAMPTDSDRARCAASTHAACSV